MAKSGVENFKKKLSLLRTVGLDSINEYEKVFKHLPLPNLEIIQVDFYLARLASKLRGRYRGIKTADSIQVATALLKGCGGFITNDNALKQIKEIEVVIIKDFSF